jgi:hypothetical protein
MSTPSGIDFSGAARCAGLLLGFLALAVVWKTAYVFAVRRCLKIQRWKSLEKIVRTLDLHDRIQHNTFPRRRGAAHAANPLLRNVGIVTAGQPTFYGAPPCETQGGGCQVEVDMCPTVVVVPATRDPDGEGWNFPQSSAPQDGGAVRCAPLKKKKKRAGVRGYVGRLFGGASEKDGLTKKFRKGELACESYTFDGRVWVPKELEGRSLYKYLRGNFLTLLGSVVALGIVLVGLKLSLDELNGDSLVAGVGSGTALALVSYFQLSSYLAPLLAYFNLLWSDHVERGDVIEVSSTLGGIGRGSQGASLTGCVLDITPTCLTVYCTKPYNTAYGPAASCDVFLDGEANVTNISNYIAKQQQQKQRNLEEEQGGPFGRRPTSPPLATPCDEYLERDFWKTRLMVYVPTEKATSSILAKYSTWTPVASMRRLG